VVAYCRVSSAGQKADLDRQVSRVVAGANRQGLAVAEVVTEVGSGLNGRRRKLPALQWCYCVVGCWWMVAWQRAQTIRVWLSSTCCGAVTGRH